MRLLAVLLVLIAPAAAAPSVRWIDKAGNVKEQVFQDVLVESAPMVRVRTAEGRTVTIPLRRVVTLFRERENVPRERALLRARLDVAAGERLGKAREVLDGILADADAPEWMHEYAAAARAVLSQRARETNAPERMDAFLRRYPKSRFASQVHRARARMRSRAGEHTRVGTMAPIENVFMLLGNGDGPVLEQYLTVVDGARIIIARIPEQFGDIAEACKTMENRAAASGDVARLIASRSASTWAILRYELYVAGTVRVLGRKPFGPMENVRILLAHAGLDLPEARCDVHLEYGRLLEECGRPDEAAVQFRKALALAPDPRRREAATRALEQ